MPFDPTNTLTLNHNAKREGKNDPDFRGVINIEGREFRVSLWRRDGQKGEFFSGPIEPKEDGPQGGGRSAGGAQSYGHGRGSGGGGGNRGGGSWSRGY